MRCHEIWIELDRPAVLFDRPVVLPGQVQHVADTGVDGE
jgi:hypothetical protein